ncbi:G-patch domain [Sesbania bispinosa]|nr:G-patch domain [Sesbania bispinosa]
MDKMSESMRIMEKAECRGDLTVKQMTQMFEAMQKSAEKRPMVDTTETAATPDYPPGFTQGLMPVTVHLNKPVQQVDPPEVQWPLYGLPPNYTPPIVNNASDQTAKPQESDAKVADSQITPPQGSAAAVLGVTPAQNVQWFPWQQATNFSMPNQSMVFGAATGEGKSIEGNTIAAVGRKAKGGGRSCAIAGWVNGNIAGDDMCEPHSIQITTIEDCEEFKRMLQGHDGQKPIPITIQVPTSFPYKDNKAVPWRYDVEVLVGDRQVGETNVDTPNVTNIAGVGGMTRSGRIYTPDEFRTTQSTLEIAHATYEKPIVESQPSDALMMVARVMLENGYQYGRGLGRYGQGVSRLPDFMGKQDKFGLGYKPSNADVKMFVEEKEEKRLARLGGREPRTGGVPICDIRESFISAGFEHSNLIAAAEGHTQGDVNNNWVRVGPPDAKLPNWEIVELPVIFNFK